MPDRELILDYASPRPRGRVRLPAESQIEIKCGRENTTVVESLKGKGNAIVAMCSAVFVLVDLLVMIVSLVRIWQLNPGTGLVEPIFLSILWVAEATVGVFVLDQTYRRTILRIGNAEMTLAQSSLFSPSRFHRWPLAEISDLRVEITQSGPDVASLAELQIRPARDVSVHLFSDRPEEEVRHIAMLISRGINGDPNIPVASQPAIPTPDAATFNRQLQTPRTLREADRAKRIEE